MSDDRRLRERSNRLARRLATPSGLHFARRRQRSGLVRESTVAEPEALEPPSSSPTPRPISIWTPRLEAGSWIFERPAPGIFADHYATRRRIPRHRRQGHRRICLFGESTAAGYLYAPHLTPAMVLEHQLAALSERASYEVLDFSRTNETLDSLLDTLAAAQQLEPDAVVVFAGNNWPLLEQPGASPYAPSIAGRLAFAAEVRAGKLTGAADTAAHALLQRIGAGLGEIERLASGAPIVLVVPEVNLLDWENRQPVPWLEGDGVRRWYRLYTQALNRLALQRWSDGLRLGECLLDLDGGDCPTTHRLLALAHRGLGDDDAAADACRHEVAVSDSATTAFLPTPRITPLLQELLRRGALHHGFACVDLPRIFAEHTGTHLTDRRLFLDYCHLTREGMKVAMAATSREILRRLEPSSSIPEWPELVAVLPEPTVSAAADATTKLGAAIHTAHRLLSVTDSSPLLRHWCREALAAWEGIAQHMLELIEARTSPCPSLLVSALERNLRSPAILTPQHGWCWEGLDLDVVDAMVHALRERGTDLRQEVDRRLLARQPAHELTDLADGTTYLRRPLERILSEVMPHVDLGRHSFFRAAWPSSRFTQIGNGGGIDLEAIARTPYADGHSGDRATRSGRIELNGRTVARLPAGRSWQRTTISVDQRYLRHGTNEIAIHWPWPTVAGESALARALERLELGREAEIHPVFGELFSLRVRLRR